MSVQITTVDGKSLVVQGEVVEVHQHLVGSWGALADFKLERDGSDVYVSTAQVVTVASADRRVRAKAIE